MGRLLREMLLVIGLQGTLQMPAGALAGSTGPADSLQQRLLQWVKRCTRPVGTTHCLGRAMTNIIAEAQEAWKQNLCEWLHIGTAWGRQLR